MQQFSQMHRSFLDEIKRKLPENISFVEIIAEDLNISNDSAYRRIRGDIHLSLEECMILSNKYNLSMDSIFLDSPNYVSFNLRAIDIETYGFDLYLKSIIANLEAIKRFELKEMIYGAKDIPIFYSFMFERMAAFKLFFWMSNYYYFPKYRNQVFEISSVPQNLISLCKKAWDSYIYVPSTEIWSEETINVTLRQIEFMYDCGRFKTKEEAINLLEDLKNILAHIQKQAEQGYKYPYCQDSILKRDKNYQLYYNEVLISNDIISSQMGDTRMTFIGHNALDILTTSDESFWNYTHKFLKNIINNSTLISEVAERVRKKIFLGFINKTDNCIDHIKNA